MSSRDMLGKQELMFKAPDYKVLIVDDNVVNLKVARKLLDEYEFQIDEVKFTFHRKIGKNTLRTQLVIVDGVYVLREDHQQYFHSVETLEQLAMQNGMRVVGTYRIYGFDEPDSDAEKIQIVLEKAEININ
jgi:CheY-like chemotaxis protein